MELTLVADWGFGVYENDQCDRVAAQASLDALATRLTDETGATFRTHGPLGNDRTPYPSRTPLPCDLLCIEVVTGDGTRLAPILEEWMTGRLRTSGRPQRVELHSIDFSELLGTMEIPTSMLDGGWGGRPE